MFNFAFDLNKVSRPTSILLKVILGLFSNFTMICFSQVADNCTS